MTKSDVIKYGIDHKLISQEQDEKAVIAKLKEMGLATRARTLEILLDEGDKTTIMTPGGLVSIDRIRESIEPFIAMGDPVLRAIMDGSINELISRWALRPGELNEPFTMANPRAARKLSLPLNTTYIEQKNIETLIDLYRKKAPLGLDIFASEEQVVMAKQKDFLEFVRLYVPTIELSPSPKFLRADNPQLPDLRKALHLPLHAHVEEIALEIEERYRVAQKFLSDFEDLKLKLQLGINEDTTDTDEKVLMAKNEDTRKKLAVEMELQENAGWEAIWNLYLEIYRTTKLEDRA